MFSIVKLSTSAIVTESDEDRWWYMMGARRCSIDDVGATTNLLYRGPVPIIVGIESQQNNSKMEVC